MLSEHVDDSGVRQTLAALVEASPEHAAGVVPTAYERCDLEPPVRHQHSRLIEQTVDHWDDALDELVDALVATVGSAPERRYEKRRRFAVRALVALHEGGAATIPDRLEPFVDRYHDGAFHDGADGEPVDPLDTDIAESAGFR